MRIDYYHPLLMPLGQQGRCLVLVPILLQLAWREEEYSSCLRCSYFSKWFWRQCELRYLCYCPISQCWQELDCFQTLIWQYQWSPLRYLNSQQLRAIPWYQKLELFGQEHWFPQSYCLEKTLMEGHSSYQQHFLQYSLQLLSLHSLENQFFSTPLLQFQPQLAKYLQIELQEWCC